MLRVCAILWRLLIGGVFLAAAAAKYQEGIRYGPPQTLYDRVVHFSPVRHYAILGAETIVGVWLISGWGRRWASGMAGFLLLAFTAVMIWELRRTDPDPCGCGISAVFSDGGDPRVALKAAIVRNVILLAGCAWIGLVCWGMDEKKNLSLRE